eukprot:m.413927 g.413927  ORF g.413927 m.413927 type:complete len:359 (+) comp29203_c0_seq1:89-1165(+)
MVGTIAGMRRGSWGEGGLWLLVSGWGAHPRSFGRALVFRRSDVCGFVHVLLEVEGVAARRNPCSRTLVKVRVEEGWWRGWREANLCMDLLGRGVGERPKVGRGGVDVLCFVVELFGGGVERCAEPAVVPLGVLGGDHIRLVDVHGGRVGRRGRRLHRALRTDRPWQEVPLERRLGAVADIVVLVVVLGLFPGPPDPLFWAGGCGWWAWGVDAELLVHVLLLVVLGREDHLLLLARMRHVGTGRKDGEHRQERGAERHGDQPEPGVAVGGEDALGTLWVGAHEDGLAQHDRVEPERRDADDARPARQQAVRSLRSLCGAHQGHDGVDADRGGRGEERRHDHGVERVAVAGGQRWAEDGA